MRDFWDNILPFAGIAAGVFLIFWFGQLMMDDYEQCIAADKQWVEGNCVK